MIEDAWKKIKSRSSKKMGVSASVIHPALIRLIKVVGSSDDEITGTHVKIYFHSDSEGKILLLNKGSSGKYWCLCPSVFSPSTKVNPGRVVLPEPESKMPQFKICGEPGTEEIVALIVQETPSWLPKPDQNPMQLSEIHLQEFLKLDILEACSIEYTHDIWSNK
jgi:hypothetical protein